MILLVPPAQKIGSSKKFLLPFSTPVWILFVFSIIFTIFATFVITKSSKSTRNFLIGKNVDKPFLNILIILFGGSQTENKLPKRNFARFLLMLFIIYTFVMRTGFYQGTLYDILKAELYAPEISSVAEYYEKGYEFYMYPGLAMRLSSLKFFKK